MAEPQRQITLDIPRFFRPRSYQREFVRTMRAGCRRAVLVWHRRAGKDATVLNWTIEAMLARAGTYFYFFPSYRQGKRILWDGLQADGKSFLSHFPEELVVDRHETDMKITLARPENLGGGHSIFQIVGADKVDNSTIGTNPVGCVFSEYSLMNPTAWDLVRPILAENNGWAVFPYTPRGKNHGHRLFQAARESGWFVSVRTVEQTVRDGANEVERSGEPVVSTEVVNQERRAGMAEELIQQEFYCSFEGSVQGSYYGDAIDRMKLESRIGPLGWNRDHLVDTSWDLGVDDETVIGFWQNVPDLRTGRDALHLIDAHAGRNMGLDDYWRFMRNEKPYTYGRHYGPWDLVVKEWGTGNTRVQTAQNLGLYFEVAPKLGLADGINAVRKMLPNVYVDEQRCAKWLDMMRAYHREFDEERMTFLDKPVHDESSHWADMTRTRAVMFAAPALGPGNRPERLQEVALTERDPFEDPQQEERNDLLSPWRRNREDWSRFDAR